MGAGGVWGGGGGVNQQCAEMFGSSIQLDVTPISHTGSLLLDWPYFVSHNLWLAYNLQFIPLPNQQALALTLALNRPDLLVTAKAE